MSSDNEGEGAGLDLFQEPEGYFQPEKPPTYATHKLESGEELKVRLVGFNPLWVSVVSVLAPSHSFLSYMVHAIPAVNQPLFFFFFRYLWSAAFHGPIHAMA